MIVEIASHLPVGKLSNDDLAVLYPEWTAKKVYEKTGIRSRVIAAKDECASNFAFQAAARLAAGGFWGWLLLGWSDTGMVKTTVTQREFIAKLGAELGVPEDQISEPTAFASIPTWDSMGNQRSWL